VSRPLTRGKPLHYTRSKVKCPTGKIRYATAIDAGIALGRARAGRPVKGRDAKVEQRQYYCSTCGGWHLTSQPSRGGSR
jgi:hypothetical protein